MVFVTINTAPSTVVLNAFTTQPNCFGESGSVTLTPSGGTAPYTTGGDAVTNLSEGTYNYTVSDINGCTATAVAIINEAPTPQELTATPTDPDCLGQTESVVLSATGGNGFYFYGGSPDSGISSGT